MSNCCFALFIISVNLSGGLADVVRTTSCQTLQDMKNLLVISHFLMLGGYQKSAFTVVEILKMQHLETLSMNCFDL